MVMKSTTAVNGSFGKLIHEGEWLTNVYGFELNAEISYEDIKRSGTRSKGKKAMTYDVTGTIKSYHVSNTFIKKIAQIMDDTKGAFVTELIGTIEDPENPEIASQKVRVKNVQFTNLPILNFEHETPTEQELQFVCEGFEYIEV